jgi:guanidinopropionase
MANDGVPAPMPEANYRPRFMEIPSFIRAPIVGDPAQLDIAMIGVPFDLGVANRAGARHGPR